jgi:putative transcriptional regulator
VHTVCETSRFVHAASNAGMSSEEVDAFIDFIALNPEGGDEIQGTGGARKIRVAGKGSGKRGAYRVITFFTGPDLPSQENSEHGEKEEAMTKKVFDEIAAGVDEAIAIARGEAKPARWHIPAELDVKAIRRKAGLSQVGFAYSYGFTIDQIRGWEQGRARPLGGLRAYLMLINLDHKSVSRILESTRRKRAA